jgi:crotonobetaine/carnitine-CoA ligase
VDLRAWLPIAGRQDLNEVAHAATIPELFRAAVEDVPDKPWLHTDEQTYTYRDALDRVERCASALRTLGIGADERVLVTARNTADYLLSWFALMEVGAVQVPVNPQSSVAELGGFVRQVQPAAVITDSGVELDLDVCRVDVADLFTAAPDGRGPERRSPDDLGVMIPTSGTTGRSKLVMQTHRAYVMAGEGFPFWMQLDASDRLMTSLPLFHLNAPAYSTLGSIAARASLVLLPQFSARDFIDAARRFHATEFNAIGAMLEILMRQPPRPGDADNPLRLCYTGPSPERERHLEIEERFGFEIVCGYALSESPYGLIWPHGSRPYGTLGTVRQHPTLGHVNDGRVMEGARELGPGSVGELELRNPTLMRGYYEMPLETEAAFHDGWLRTGDLVRVGDDGTYTFVGRAKQVIRRRGENLSPTEVETVLDRHPDVSESAVIGVPSELSEEDVKAFVVPAPGRTADAHALHAHARAHLAAFKVPRYFEVVPDIPHTPTGRLAKHELSAERTPGEVDMEAAGGGAP